MELCNFANFSVMQVKILEQFLNKNLFLEVDALKNAKDFDKSRNKQP